MPYLTGDRYKLERAALEPKTPGELNYAISRLAIDYIHGCPPSYAILNEVVGAMELAKQEFIRRVVNIYEETKITDNTDIYQDIEKDIFKV
jgi:hypothetical protein